MDAEKYLKQARTADMNIDELLLRRETLIARIESINVHQSDVKVMSTPSRDRPFAKWLDDLNALESVINYKIDRYVDLKNQIEETILALEDDEEQLVLRYKYFHDYTWERIGSKMHMSRSTAQRKHDAAIKKIVLPEEPIVL